MIKYIDEFWCLFSDFKKLMTWCENLLKFINNFRQDLLNKNLVEPIIDHGVQEMNNNVELM